MGASELDKRRTKEYWGVGREMHARAFESYVIAELEKKSEANDYLANIATKEDFLDDMLKSLLNGKTSEDSYPYLVDSEIEAVSKAFDNLFTTLKTKKTDKGTALYSKGSTTSGLSISQTEQTLTQQFGNAMKSLLKSEQVKVVRTEARLPEKIKRMVHRDRYADVSISEKAIQMLGFDKVALRANWKRLADRHSEYYQSPQDAKDDVEFVLSDPAGWYVHADGRVTMFRSGDKLNPSLRIDLRKGQDDTYSIISVYKQSDAQIARKMKQKSDALEQAGLPVSLTIASYFDRSSRPASSADEALQSKSDSLSIDPDVKLSKDGKIMGAFDPATGVTYIVAESNDEATLEGVLLHEGTHALETTKEGRSVKSKAIQHMLMIEKKGNAESKAWIKRAQKVIPNDTPESDVNEEVLAYATQQYTQDQQSVPASIGKLVKRYLAEIKAFLFEHTPALFKTGKLLKLDPATLAAIARQNLGRMAKTKQGNFAGVLAPLMKSMAEQYGISEAEAKRQYDAVVAKYKGTDGWMKANNGKPTNLNERQWVQVRTPAFREWFGEWGAANKTVEPIILKLEGWSGSAGQLARMARDVYSSELQKTSEENSSLGAEVLFTAEGKGEAYGARGKLRSAVYAEAVKSLRELVHKAVRVDVQSADSRRTNDSRAFHTLVSALIANGKEYAVKITVREALNTPDGKNHKFYDIGTVEIKESPSVHGLGKAAYPAPAGASSRSIAELAKLFNIDIEATTSKVVDENGEPMVVYHGASGDIKAFDRSKIGDNTGSYSIGFYASSSTKESSRYATGEAYRPKGDGNVMPLFLNIKTPYKGNADGEGIASNAIDFNKSEYVRAILDSRKTDNEYDGIITKGRDMWDGGDGFNYVSFKPNQIKSATGNTGQFNKDNADIRYSRASTASEAVESGNLGLPEETRTDKFVKYFQDGFNRIKKVQEHIKATGGKVDESNDVYRAEERSSGKITARLDDLDSDHVKPLLDAMRGSGIELDVLDDYLIAKHAEERNEYIASINPDQQDGGSGITTKDAQATLRGFEDAGQTKALEELAGRVYAINNKAIQDMLDGSLIDKETANLWQNQYKYYVPLKGKSGEESGGGTGRGYEVRNSGVKAAMGRGAGNMAESPLAHSIAQAESGIVRAEKMVVGHHLAKLALDNPDPSLWTVTKSNYVKFQELDGEIGEGFSKPPVEMIEGRDYHRVAGITPADAAAYRKARKDYAEGKGDKPTRPSTKVYFRVDPQYNNRDDVFTTLIKGQRYSIHIKDQVMAEQMKKLTASQLNAVVQHAGVLNRYLAMINTALNPEFVITNFERDFTTAGINMGGEHGKKMAWEMVKATPAAMNGIRNYLFGDGKNEWAKIYNEMRHAGGTIGFFGLEDNEAKIVNINKRLHNNDANAWATTKRGFRAVRDKVMDANSVIENATRLAAYKVAIDNGMTKNQAASLAKNLTVNFNRKGELGPAMNSAYLFFNASIQGSARIFSALKHPATQKIVAGVAAAGFGLAAYNMAAGGDDDDGVSRWEKVPDYIKQTHIVIMQDDGTYLKYKLPYGYNAFWYAGVALHDLAYGKNTTTISTAMNLATAVLNAYNPMAGSDILDTVTPTALKPLEQHIRNANFMGSQIKPENKFDLDNKPDSSKAFRSTNPYLKAFVQELNSITGGDENHAGLIDVSPETVKHYVGWVTGGAGMTVFRTGDTLANFAAGEEIEQRGVPLWRTFGGEVSTRYDSNRYYDMLDELKATKKQFDLLKNTDIGEAIIYREKNMSELRKQRQIYKTNKRIKLLRNMKDAAEKRRDSGAAKRYGEQIARIMRRFTAN